MTYATKTASSYGNGKGSVEFQITAAMIAVAAALHASDEGDWVNASNLLISRSSPARERAAASEYVTGDTSPIVSVAEQIGEQVHTIVLIDTDGVAEDYGNNGSINLHDDVLHPCFDYSLPIPWRFTNKGNTTGNKLFTFTATNEPRVTSVGEVEIEAGANARGKRTYMLITSGAATEGTVA